MLRYGSVPCLEARLGPATAHGHRSQALRSLRVGGACIPPWPCRRSRAPQPGPVGQVGRLSETPIAFARWCLCGIETAIAFAGEKRAFLVQFSGAEVMQVSVVPCWGCAVVLLVSMSPCCRTSCAIFVALRGLVRARMRKSSLSTRKMAQNGWYMARWANFFAETRLGGCAGRVFSRKCGWRGRAGRVLMQRGPGSWAHLLAPLTLQCAAKPYWWRGGQPAQVATSRVNVRIKGPRPPPIGLTCG